MGRRESIQKLKQLKYQALMEKKELKNPPIECNWTGNCEGILDTTNEIYDAMVIPFLHLKDALPGIRSFSKALTELVSIDNVLPILKKWDTVTKGVCINKNICELNPASSRYKYNLESEREESLEKENRRAITFDGETVVCSKRNCKKFGNFETCHHGVKHTWTGSCMMRCERFTDAYCDIGGC